MEMTCKPLIADAAKQHHCITLDSSDGLGAEFSMLSMITRLESLVGLQKNITLKAENSREMVRALRFHPRYEHLSMKELLQIVRNRTGDESSMSVKLSEKLIPVYSDVLLAEGIGVLVEVV